MFEPLTPTELSALELSLKVSATATLLCLPLGILFGWLLARKTFLGKLIVEALLSLPLVLPPVVTGYLLLLAFGRNGWIGRWFEEWWGWTLPFHWSGAAVAAAVVSFPLMVRSVKVSMQAVDPRLEAAARTLGASPARVFLGVTLPLALPGVLAGTILCFARSLGEFGATILFAGNVEGSTRTIPLAIYSSLQRVDGDVAAARLVALSVVIAVSALALHEWLVRRIARAPEQT